MLKYVLTFLLFITFSACKNTQNKPNNEQNQTAKQVKTNEITIISPQNGQQVRKSEIIDVVYQINNDSLTIDTTVFFVNNKEIARFHGTGYKWTMNETRAGRQSLRLSMQAKGKEIANASCMVKYFPPPPQNYTYSVVKQYSHNTAFFTQGLFFDNGFLYEGTGQYGSSALMKIEFETGKVINSVNLSKEFFGEGITLLDDKIYQLSWQERQCFVYDKNSFDKIATIPYQNEGWGITTVGNLLAVSNGSSIISFVKPDNFAEVRHIEVCNDKGNVSQLNELEYIDGLIWANVWQTNTIVMINPESGAVVGEIDFSGIYSGADSDNCFNGIACDEKTNRIFVTGKRWSRIFEVKVMKK
jgi:glutamine cyclotransferase